MISYHIKNAPLWMRTLLQRKMSHRCDAKAAREFRKRNSLFFLYEEIAQFLERKARRNCIEKERQMRKNKSIYKMVLAAMFLAMAYVLPFFTGQIPQIGSMLCPMHIPVLLCGFLCGWPWGLAVGFIAPLLRSMILGMPPMFPTAVCMAFELATYGAMTGIFYKVLPKKKGFIYVSLVTAMVIGRLVWGIAMLTCTGIKGGSFGIKAFLAGAITNALPGIVIQLVLVPIVVMLLERAMRSEENC